MTNDIPTRAARVLVVDDERHIARLLEFILKKEGYQVVVACDGEKALAVLDEVAPDVVCLDLVLPGISGLDVLKQIRSTPQHAHRAVIVLSASLYGSMPDEVIEAGANAHCTKPVAPSTLLKTLSNLGVPPRLTEVIDAAGS